MAGLPFLPAHNAEPGRFISAHIGLADGSSSFPLLPPGCLLHDVYGLHMWTFVDRLEGSILLSLFFGMQGAEVFYEGSSKQGIYMALSADVGRSWTPPKRLLAATGTPLWAPVLHVQVPRPVSFRLSSGNPHNT